MTADLARFAAQEFRTLQSSAPRAIAAGKVTREHAEGKLAAWLAIAAMASAAVPAEPTGLRELDRLLPQFREAQVYRPRRGWRAETVPEAEARAAAADAIAPRERWLPELRRALEAAWDHDMASPRAQTLAELAALLDQRLLVQAARRAAHVAETASLAVVALGLGIMTLHFGAALA